MLVSDILNYFTEEILKILSAFLNSFSSFTLFLYLFDTNIPISEHDKNINVYITIFNPNIV